MRHSLNIAEERAPADPQGSCQVIIRRRRGLAFSPLE